MPRDINDLVAAAIDTTMRVFRLPGLNRPGVYALSGLPAAQVLWERIARRRAVAAVRDARLRCPAYAAFLQAQSFQSSIDFDTFSLVPETTKENYVKKFSIEERCFNGRIPSRGVVIDESSGSSGTPNNWVRGRQERSGVRRMLEHSLALRFRDQPLFLVNCFALGPWATGMNLTMSLVDSAIVKSVGPEKQKLEHTLRTFGPRYVYAVAGYPPFIKDFLDTTSLDLSGYHMHLLVGGEGMSEALRDRFLQVFKTVHSSYGASDLEINLAAETPLSIAVRRLCVQRPDLSRSLFGRDEPPMLFQHDPLDYLIETNGDGEMVFTLLRPGYASPKIRYNLRDLGGVVPHRRLVGVLREHGVDVAALPRGLAFPFLHVGGRSDLTVAFYGAKIFTNDLDVVITSLPDLGDRVHSFQMRVAHDEGKSETLHVALERARSFQGELDPLRLRDEIVEGLKRVNQDFREVSKMFAVDRVQVELHDFGSGPFADRDVRVKNRYIRT